MSSNMQEEVEEETNHVLHTDVVSRDLEEASKVIKEIINHAADVSKTVEDLMTRQKNGEFNTKKGISLLDVKNHTMLEYLTNLVYVVKKKVSGKQIENDPAIERLVELRVVLEKIKPIELRLNYQIQKLLTVARTGAVSKDDPLQYKPNPDNMFHEDDDDEEEDEGDGGSADVAGPSKKTPKSNIYVPPRIAPAYYDGDETQQTRQMKQLEQAKKRALSSNVLQELRKEYDMGPEEIREHTDTHRQKIEKEMKEREKYEEEYMMRLPMTKKQKYEARRVTTMSSLSNIARFDDISALELPPGALPLAGKRKSKKFTSKKGKGKWKSFKRKKR